ncbi:MAG: hypothetical protein M9910_08530 [Kiritimatiellae bacterium]|nr:hypothetical protein [Kiritimatiellia bacterium]
MSTSPSTPRRVAVGMSGGIDRPVAAVLLVEQGWEVIGFTLHMVKACAVARSKMFCARAKSATASVSATTPSTS